MVDGFSVGGRNINNIRYADDTALVADSKEKLQELLTTIQRKSEEHGLNINTGKTEILVVSKKAETPRCNIHINNKQLKQVDKFCYLGSTIKSDGRCDGEIKKRIAEAKNAFNKMRNFLTNKNISKQIRKRGVKTFVWSVMTYGAEAWTISNTMEKRIEAFEMWCWRRMQKIAWTERKSNVEVLQSINTERELIKIIRTRQMSFLGHVMRRGELENLSLTGKIEGKRARGRQRDTFMKSLARILDGNWTTGSLLQATTDRKRWQSMIANVRVDTAHR